jgi:serine/threonine-protein kinase HipA
MPTGIRALAIRLGQFPVGHLSEVGGIHRFSMASDFVERFAQANAPMLSLSFLGLNEGETRARAIDGDHLVGVGELPPFFANLLPPQSAVPGLTLLDPLAQLARCGGNLPGNVVAATAHGVPDAVLAWHAKRATAATISAATPLEASSDFCLPGSQPKLAMIERAGEFHRSDDPEAPWFAKLAPHRPVLIPAENEFAALMLARAAGVRIVEVKLVDAQLVDLPEGHPVGKILMVRRFDRQTTGRIHTEDLAQVLGRRPTERHTSLESYDTVARILVELTGARIESALELVRRLVVSILIGNSHLHLKNIALVYPDGRIPELAPAFDMLALPGEAGEVSLAHPLARERDPNAMSIDTFKRFAARVGLPVKAVTRTVRDTIGRAKDEWPRMLFTLPLDVERKRRILGRLVQLPITKLP